MGVLYTVVCMVFALIILGISSSSPIEIVGES